MPLHNANSRLGDAIAAVNSAKSRLDKIERALDETKGRSYDSRRFRNECEIQVNAAKERESKRAVDVLLGASADDQTSLADYEATLAEADREYASLKKLVFALQVEQQVTECQLRDAKDARENAVRAVLQNHPSVVALYQRYTALQDEIVAMNAALKVIWSADGYTVGGWTRGFPVMDRVERGDFDPTLRDQWAAAIKQLTETGETEFPQ